jgi:hypothetical protein
VTRRSACVVDDHVGAGIGETAVTGMEKESQQSERDHDEGTDPEGALSFDGLLACVRRIQLFTKVACHNTIALRLSPRAVLPSPLAVS